MCNYGDILIGNLTGWRSSRNGFLSQEACNGDVLPMSSGSYVLPKLSFTFGGETLVGIYYSAGSCSNHNVTLHTKLNLFIKISLWNKLFQTVHSESMVYLVTRLLT